MAGAALSAVVRVDRRRAGCPRERGLQEAGIGGSDAIPSERIEIGGEILGRVESALGKPCPFLTGQDSGVQFALPEHAELLPLRVVFDAGEFDERGILRPWPRYHALHQVQSLADADDLADFRDSGSDTHIMKCLEHKVSRCTGACGGTSGRGANPRV